MNVRIPLVAVLSMMLLAPATQAQEEESLELRSISLQHVNVKEANAILRSLLNIRKTAVDEERNRLHLADSRSSLDAAERLLRDVDAPAPKWQGRIVAETSGGKSVLRTIPLSGTGEWSWGESSADTILLKATGSNVGENLSLSLLTSTRAGSATRDKEFKRSSQESHLVSDASVVDLLLIEPSDARIAIATLLGTADPVSAVRLEVERVDSPGGARRERPSPRR